MSRIEIILSAVAGVILISVLALFIVWKKPKRLKMERYIADWKALQAFCRDKNTWYQALVDADKLLDKALKQRKYKGKRMGERLVAAQRAISNNDSIWAAHNLTKKASPTSPRGLTESKVKAALVAYRQALVDIGALPNGKSRNS
jgi:hypothetical protein